MRITGLANSITTLGGSISETEIVKKMLQVVLDHLEQVAISIETLLDVNDLMVEEVTGNCVTSSSGSGPSSRKGGKKP